MTHTTYETADELDGHLREVREVADELGQTWTFGGIRAFEDLADVPWMPKSRYRVMKQYLPTRGALAHWMMKMTCTVQANFDYRSEADALDIVRLCTRVGPAVTALFARSPIRLGADRGVASERMLVWEETDPDRCGIPDFFVDEGATFADYVEYILDVPMFFVRRDDAYVDLSGIPFRDLLEGKVDGMEATLGDFDLHLSTAFPDVRIKSYIEVRTADCGGPAHIVALPALWKGLIYDAEARADAHRLLPLADIEAARALARATAREGLDARYDGVSMRELATELVRLAGDGLDRIAKRDGHPSERAHLAPLLDDQGLATNAVGEVRDAWAAAADPAAFVAAFALDRYLDRPGSC